MGPFDFFIAILILYLFLTIMDFRRGKIVKKSFFIAASLTVVAILVLAYFRFIRGI